MDISIPRPAELIVEIAKTLRESRVLDDRQRRELAMSLAELFRQHILGFGPKLSAAFVESATGWREAS
jgi:hypothetical protein